MKRKLSLVALLLASAAGAANADTGLAGDISILSLLGRLGDLASHQPPLNHYSHIPSCTLAVGNRSQRDECNQHAVLAVHGRDFGAMRDVDDAAIGGTLMPASR